MNIQLVNIDQDPMLETIIDKQNHVFAGHVEEVLGVNYYDSKKIEHSDKKKFKSKEEAIAAMNQGNLVTIWVNHKLGQNNLFSVKISGSENISKFVDVYGDFFGNGTSFLVCDDVRHVYESNAGTEKKFYAIDTLEQLENDFRLWH